MHHVPRDIAEKMDHDSYSSKTGVKPQDLASQTPGQEGVEAIVEGDQDAPASAVRGAEATRKIARERFESDGIGGQG